MQEKLLNSASILFIQIKDKLLFKLWTPRGRKKKIEELFKHNRLDCAWPCVGAGEMGDERKPAFPAPSGEPAPG